MERQTPDAGDELLPSLALPLKEATCFRAGGGPPIAQLPCCKQPYRAPVGHEIDKLFQRLQGVPDGHVAALRGGVMGALHSHDARNDVFSEVRLGQADDGRPADGIGRRDQVRPGDQVQVAFEDGFDLSLAVHAR